MPFMDQLILKIQQGKTLLLFQNPQMKSREPDSLEVLAFASSPTIEGVRCEILPRVFGSEYDHRHYRFSLFPK
jgi:hypothetical protein